MNTENPLFFLYDVIRAFISFLDSKQIMGLSLFMWFISFIIVSMIISVFWRGARG